MLINITFIMIGFSIVCALLLLITYWFIYQTLENTWLARTACTVLLIGLCLLQWQHLGFLHGDLFIVQQLGYRLLLFTIAPCFYLFSRETLQTNTRNHLGLALHFAPLLISPFVNAYFSIPLSFVLGSGYALWFSYCVYRLKDQRQHFRLEFSAFMAFAFIALSILVLGLLMPVLGEHVFVLAYANLISVSFFVILLVLMRFPDIGQKTREAVVASYAASTLKNVECEPLIAQLQQLMEQEKIYRDEGFSLSQLAEELKLSSHQTSELINTHFGIGFSRLIREYRIAEAKHQLLTEPKASVLSVGLAVGFTSQSNFYTAFRESTNETPGQYRKRESKNI